MKLVTKEIKRLLDSNNKKKPDDRVPYLKLFNPCGAATWLITEFNEGEGMFFGLCAVSYTHLTLPTILRV